MKNLENSMIIKLLVENRYLKQEVRMFERIVANQKKEIRELKLTHRRNARWNPKLKHRIKQLRDVKNKDFSEISKILMMNNKDCRRLYSASRYKSRRQNKIILKNEMFKY